VQADIEKLKGAGAHYVFLPDTKELYHGMGQIAGNKYYLVSPEPSRMSY
jgi:pantothenate synthetase